MDALADAALSEYAGSNCNNRHMVRSIHAVCGLAVDGEKPRPIFVRNEDSTEDEEDSTNEDSVEDKPETSPVKKQLQKEDDEYFRISNIRLDLEEERRLTRDLKLELANVERE